MMKRQGAGISRDTPSNFLVQAEDDYVDGANLPITHWPGLAAAWLHSIVVIGN